METLVAEDGAAAVLKILDAEFSDPRDVLLVEATDEALYMTTKLPGEEITMYQTRLESKFRRLEQVGSFELPAELKGFILAKQAGLGTSEVRELLTLTGGSLDYTKVKTSMRRLMWDFSKPSGPRRSTTAKGVLVAENDDDETEFELPDFEEIMNEQEWSEEEAKGVMLAYTEARQRLQARKLGRGFFPAQASTSMATANTNGGAKSKGTFGKSGGKGGMDVSQLKAKTRCHICGQLGHWKRECPRRGQAHYATEPITEKDAQSNNVFPSNASYFVVDVDQKKPQGSSSSDSGDHVSSAIRVKHDFRQELFIRGLGHRGVVERSSCPESECMSLWTTCNLETPDCLLSEEPTSGSAHVSACIDTGCTRTLIGEKTLGKLEACLEKKGVKCLRYPGQCQFRFGADFTFCAQELVVIPCSIQDKLFSISAYVVTGATPLLVSLSVLRALQISLCLHELIMSIGRWNIQVPLQLSNGHLYVDLWQGLKGKTCRLTPGMQAIHVAKECVVYERSCSEPSLKSKDTSPSLCLLSTSSRDNERCQKGSACPHGGRPREIADRCQDSLGSHALHGNSRSGCVLAEGGEDRDRDGQGQRCGS